MATGVIVRLAGEDDLEAVRAVVDEAFLPYVERIGARPFPLDADYPALLVSGQVWVADRLDGEVCGVLVLTPADDHLLLDTVAVTDRVRGDGVGATLMAFAEDRARGLRLPEVRLYTNELMWENLEYYPKLGYVEQRRETVADVFHRVFFTKSVGQ